MKVVIDIECNSLRNPTKIWVVVCVPLEDKTGQPSAIHIFRNVTENETEKQRFLDFAEHVELWIGHNVLEYDFPVLSNLIGFDVTAIYRRCVDTLIVSKLHNYSRDGHSIEDYGVEFGIEKQHSKVTQSFFNQYSQELEDRCVSDARICSRVYAKYATPGGTIYDSHDTKYHCHLNTPLQLEQHFQFDVVNSLQNNGFGFDHDNATRLLVNVSDQLAVLDKDILSAFPPREVLIKEFTPKATKFGTINKSSVPRALHSQIHEYEVGQSYRHTKLEPFNPSSHKQLIEVLTEAKWQPIDKTKTHIEANRVGEITDKHLKYGWRINENNLATLPSTAPPPAKLLAKRILLEARRRTLEEWISLVRNERIYGKFYGIGAWTHRMAHRNPNTANIPSALHEDGSAKLLGKEMRSLWRAPADRLLVGVDAEGIQLRIFAHYINDAEFTDALVRGHKEDKTDPHSLNQRILGRVCKTRQAAKRFTYALLLGGGISKLAQILGCSVEQAKEALDRLLQRYTGFKRLKETRIPADAKRGSFIGLDGRTVVLPGDTVSKRQHLCMSGYLQNGESIAIKRTAVIALPHLKRIAPDGFFVNIVHDEYVIECPNDRRIAREIQGTLCEIIQHVGQDLKLKCPLKGDGGIGLTWMDIH